MTPINHNTIPDTESDPFRERSRTRARLIRLLGVRVYFHTNNLELLRLVDLAYSGLPPHRPSTRTLDIHVNLIVAAPQPSPRRGEPPQSGLLSGAGYLGGATDRSDFVVLSPRQRSALVVVSSGMLRHPYHLRYELIEFAVFTLAARVRRLVPLHAACVGIGRHGVLLMGPSGAGKSTVALQCLLDGFDFLSEDSVFMDPHAMLATGVANFLHIRADSLRWLGRSPEAAAIRRSPVIRRRSGVKKLEIDLRSGPFNLARPPLKIRKVIFLSSRNAGASGLLVPLSTSELVKRLAATQAYGTSQPQWRAFSRNASRLEGFELRRGRHPREAADKLRSLLTGP